jgi:Zn-finger nucleic acid-binding protein
MISSATSRLNNAGKAVTGIMNCPVCKSPELVATNLETNLTSFKCPDCGGNWIRGAAYWKWLEVHGPNLPEREADESLALAETHDYLDCPECRFRMVKFQVGRGLEFALDHCDGCKGIWLDHNEWETLKKRNLHDDLNAMLTSFWQASARKEVRKKSMEHIYTNRFGAADYAEIKRIRLWLDANENKSHLIAYLTDADPFDV